MKSFRNLFWVVLASLALVSCATSSITSDISDYADLEALDSFYVARLPADNRGVEQKIAQALRQRGFRVSSGEAGKAPANIDAIVTYRDNWMWDITMYMLEITIEFRDPQTEVVFATGRSHRTSLVRKSPEFMIDEVLTDIFTTN